MEGMEGSLSNANVDSSKMNCVSGQEMCTMLDDGSFPSAETIEKHSIEENDFSTDPDLEQRLCDTDSSRPHNQQDACAGGESDVDGNMAVSCETECSADSERSGKHLPEPDTPNDCFLASGKVIPSEPEHTEFYIHHKSGKPRTDPAVSDSLDNSCQKEAEFAKASSDNLTNDTCPPSPDTQQKDSGNSYPKELETETRALNGETHSHERSTKNVEVKTGTGYLDGVISSIQSLPCNQLRADTDRDTVNISRAELTLMVEQTLVAQTMSNCMQDLVQKNKVLNQQNDVLKDTIVQARNWERGDKEKHHPKSLPTVSQGTGAEVFRFPGSLPALSVQSGSPRPPPNTDHTEQNDAEGLQTDGELRSASLQLSSQIFWDGDSAPDIFAAGQSPHVLHGLNAAASAASVPAQGGLPPNIPNSSLLDEACTYSMGPQQGEESGVGCVGVSQKLHMRVVEQLEQMKRFAQNISQQAGIHPDNMLELVSLREKVHTLHQENCQLKMELKNKPRSNPVICRDSEEHARLMAKIKQLEEKIEKQKDLEKQPLDVIAKLFAENKMLKSGVQSQPPSSVGLQAMATISHTAIPLLATLASVGCQSEESYMGIQEYAARLAHMQEALNKQQLFQDQQSAQAKNMEAEYVRAMESVRSELQAKDETVSTLRSFANGHQQSLQELRQQYDGFAQQLNREIEEKQRQLSQERKRIKQLEKRCQEAEREGVDFSHEAEKYKKEYSREMDRNKELEKMIKDERRRYDRDERELLERVKVLTEIAKQTKLLKRLVLVVDRARLDGRPLPQDLADKVAALRRENPDTPVAAAAPPSLPTVRPSSSWSNVSGVSAPPPLSGPRLQQPHSFSGSSLAAGQPGTFPQRGSGSGPRGGGVGGRGAHASSHTSS
ncbi:hypothetical protein ACOMHN_037622 [Nucella lapillus]